LSDAVKAKDEVVVANQAAITEANQQVAALKAENDALKAEKRDGEITALESDLNKEFSADQRDRYRKMGDTAFKALAGDLREFGKPTLPTALKGETATAGKTEQTDERALSAKLYAQVAGLASAAGE
jgi:hypothetical protein